MSELQIQRCRTCQAAWYPDRLRCPSCGDDDFHHEPAGEGLLEQTTELRRGPDAQAQEVRLGSVRLEAGPVIIARVNGAVQTGDRVRLDTNERGAPQLSDHAGFSVVALRDDDPRADRRL